MNSKLGSWILGFSLGVLMLVLFTGNRRATEAARHWATTPVSRGPAGETYHPPRLKRLPTWVALKDDGAPPNG